MSETTKERHTIHCRAGGKVVIDGDRVEVHLPGPVVVSRRKWVKYLTPHEEAQRAATYEDPRIVEAMLKEAFTAVPMKVYPDDD